MGMDALRLEACLLRSLAKDQERPGAGEWTSLRVEEQLGPVPPVEVRAPAGEVTPKCLDGLAADRHDPFLVALADAAHHAFVERDPALLEPDRLGHTQACAVQQLDQGAVAEVTRLRSGCGFDQALGLAG